jgi:hypothetical protein
MKRVTIRSGALPVQAIVTCCIALQSARAQSWAEVGDAGQTIGTAQVPIGVGFMSHITGILGSQADMYLIHIPSGGLFTATTETAGTTFDTQLFLFNAAGIGIAMNDDTTGSPPFHSTLSGPLLSSLPAGNYLLAISTFGTEPVSAGGLIFPDVFPGVFGPTGPGGGVPLSSWTGGTSAGSYDILMTGGVTSVIPPAPPSVALLALAAMAGRRRRRGKDEP